MIVPAGASKNTRLPMARRRMYLFERAYVDYVERLRRFIRRTVAACSGIWRSFWRGAGAAVIEVILRLLIVVTAIALAVMYVRYESSQGRGISAGTIGVFGVIVLYVSVLLWGWKAPVHFMARTLSGASASGIVLLLALVATALATIVFSPYLLVLFALTALSVVLFLPMRTFQEIWLLYRRIAYRCPYDDCLWQGLPIHICTCGEAYPDLLPSFYGIFHHSCRHGGETIKLPTMDLLGRNRLPRLCGGCKRPLIYSSLGELSEWPIAIVGGASAGKTIFLRQATRELTERFATVSGAAVTIDSEAQAREQQREMERLNAGQLPAKTAGDTMLAIGLAVRIPKRIRCLLYLFDAPGEDFGSMERFGRKQVMQHIRGVILLIDAFSLTALSDHARQSQGSLKPSETSLRAVVANLIHNVDLRLVRRAEDKCKVPLAVVLSKADAFPSRDYPFLADLCPRDGSTADDALSARCRVALDKLGEGSSVRALEQKFATVRYFACSALGRMPDLRNTSPFQPVGVAEPFQWLMETRSDR